MQPSPAFQAALAAMEKAGIEYRAQRDAADAELARRLAARKARRSTDTTRPVFALADSETFHESRIAHMHSARQCRAALTDPKGRLGYSPEDATVKAAVGNWVARARRAHRIAMGREPLIDSFAVITGSTVTSGPLYATEQPCRS